MTPSFELMAPLMFAGLIIVLLIGYPVAFSLSAVGLGFGFRAIQLGYFDFVLCRRCERIFGIASNQLLLSIRSSPSWARYWSAALWPKILDTMGRIVRPDPRRSCLFGHPGRSVARGDYRHWRPR